MKRKAFTLRLLLLAPVCLLLVSGVRQAFNSPFKWTGKTDTAIPHPNWVLSLDIVLLALPFILLGLWGFASIWRSTRQQYHVAVLYMLIGLPVILLASTLLLVLDYNGMAGGGGDPYGSLFMTLLLALGAGGCLGGFILFYVRSVVPDGSGKYDKRADEPDATGSLISELRG